MGHERITLQDTPMSAIIKLADGNPGAIGVCTELFKEGARIDPDAFGGGIAPLISLDSRGIYGSDIWCLYKYVCRESIVHVIAVLRAVQLGLFADFQLQHAIGNRGDGCDPAMLFDAACERLPNFKAANALEADAIEVA